VEAYHAAAKKEHESSRQTYEGLKRQVFLHNLMRSLRFSIFLFFHLAALVLILFLGILSRSLLALGYIVVCLYLMFENPYYFSPGQTRWNMQSVIHYFLKPYVLIDLLLQILYQVPFK